MKVLVTGGRDFRDIELLKRALNETITKNNQPITTIIHGDARGADFLASVIAIEWGIPELRFPADWSQHGKAAGHIRNTQMLDQGLPDCVVAMPGGRGTNDMVQQAQKRSKMVYDYRHYMYKSSHDLTVKNYKGV